MRSIPRPDQAEVGTLSGRILICGTGFIVLAGMWAILGFFRFEGGQTTAFVIDFVLMLVHVMVGLLVFRRTRAIWYVGIALCGVAIAATLPNHYYLPVGANAILGALLYLSRLDFPDMQPRV